MKILIEIKNGSISYVASNSKDVLLQVIDHDLEGDTKINVPEYSEREVENLGSKGLRTYIENILDENLKEW
jgi:hypothetical protein